nr:hypothetical protein [Moraxella osloensis]
MINSVYSVIMTDDVKKSADFFIKNFSFDETFASDWYISLKNNTGFELAFIDYQHDTIPIDFRKVSSGIILNLEVDNVDGYYNKLKTCDEIRFLLDLTIEDFGQKHFIIETSQSLLVDVIQIIPPSEEFAKNYL